MHSKILWYLLSISHVQQNSDDAFALCRDLFADKLLGWRRRAEVEGGVAHDILCFGLQVLLPKVLQLTTKKNVTT